MKTNLSNLQQPPIVLERNALLLEVARLNGVVEQKDKEVFTFKNEVISVTSQFNSVSNIVNNAKSKELSLTNDIKQKDNTISVLRSKEQELLNRASLLNGNNILLLQSVDELKLDKQDLRQDKIKLMKELEEKNIIIENQRLEIAQLKAQLLANQNNIQLGSPQNQINNNPSNLLNSGGTTNSIYLNSNSESEGDS